MHMKIFVIGGLVSDSAEKVANQHNLLRKRASEVGADIARARHTLIVCSPFDGSADIEALKGFAAMAASEEVALGHAVEIHHPDGADVATQVASVLNSLGLSGVHVFRHPSMRTQE